MTNYKNIAQGFSLIEVLVALVIIMGGILGMAGMQALSITRTNTAQMEMLAALEAQSLGAMMQSNPNYWQAGLFPTQAFTVNGSTLSASGLNGRNKNCSTTSCTAAIDVAAYNLKTWGTNLASVLPGATSTITCQAANPAACQITINWIENTGAILNKGTANINYTTPMSYTLIYTF